MTDSINDDGAEAIPVSAMPFSMLPMFQEIATSGQFTVAGKKQMGSQLLYPFYGGKSLPDETIRDPSDWWGAFGVTIHRDAAQIGPGQCAVIIINTSANTLTVTRPYRDGGWMLRYPVDENARPGVIVGRQSVDGVDTFGVGAFINDIASIFYGSGAVLYLTPSDSSFPTQVFGYGTSIGGGGGMALCADKAKVPDPEAWFKKNADNNTFPAGGSLRDKTSKIKMTASYAPWDGLQSNHGGVYTVLIESV